MTWTDAWKNKTFLLQKCQILIHGSLNLCTTKWTNSNLVLKGRGLVTCWLLALLLHILEKECSLGSKSKQQAPFFHFVDGWLVCSFQINQPRSQQTSSIQLSASCSKIYGLDFLVRFPYTLQVLLPNNNGLLAWQYGICFRKQVKPISISIFSVIQPNLSIFPGCCCYSYDYRRILMTRE